MEHTSQLYSRLDPSKKYQLMTAGVQAGKTSEMLTYCAWSLQEQEADVLFVLQNSKADREQLTKRISQHPQKQSLPYLIPEGCNGKYQSSKVMPGMSKKFRIVLCLGNAKSLENAFNIIKRRGNKFHMCLDEADLTIKSKAGTSKFETVYREIAERANHTLGVTATSIALHVHENKVDDVVNLKVPEDYTGIENIRIRAISADATPEDTWDTVYRSKHYKPEQDRVVLHVEARIIKIQENLADKLCNRYPDWIICVYNGEGISVFKRARSLQIDTTEDTDPITFSKEKLNVTTISEALQLLYNRNPAGERKISVIAGGMATRGISYVSSDYSIHLTDQIFVPSSTAHGENIIQSLRLLGRYQDAAAPTLWTYPHVVNRIKNQHRIIHQFNKQREKDITTEVQFDPPQIAMCRPAVMEEVTTEIVDEATRTLNTK